jgi:hypothetical protein
MNNRDYCGLIFTVPVMLFYIAVCVTHGSDYDVYRICVSHPLVDNILLIAVVLGFVVGPGLLVQSFVSKVASSGFRTAVVPFVISEIMFIAVSVSFMVFFKQVSVKLLVLPILYIIVYSCTCIIMYLRIQRQQKSPV